MAALDYTGTKLAIGGSLKVLAPQGDLHAELPAHNCEAVAWAPQGPRTEGLLASGSADGHVVVWRVAARAGSSISSTAWQKVHELHITGAVAALDWADQGVCLAIGGADELGIVTVLTSERGHWQVRSFEAHPGGVEALSWSPGGGPLLLATGLAVARGSSLGPRLASGGQDGAVRVWQQAREMWECTAELLDDSHGSAELTGVAWRPARCLPTSCVASCYSDGSVLVWTQEFPGRPWKQDRAWLTNAADARSLTWSPCGVFLAVSVGSDAAEIFRQVDDGSWDLVADVDVFL